MDKENIAGFLDAAMRDKALAEKLAALATEQGYGFAAEELLELGETQQLSDNKIEAVAGGMVRVGPFNPTKGK